MSTILKLENINYGYIDGGYRREILKNLSYEFEEGTFYTILGPSGSGKTTLLSIMAGLDKQESGTVYYDGEDIAKMGLTKYRRNKVGVVFQSYNLISYLTGLENVLLAMTETDNKLPPNHKELAYAVLRMVGIVESKADRMISKLSGGEQQRIAIARAIAGNEDLIFADEPTGNLDSATGAAVVSLLRSICRDYGTTILMVTHDRDLAASCERQIVIADGRVAAPVHDAGVC